MKAYESIYIIKPGVEEEKRNELIEKFKSVVSQNGELTNIDEWGIRRLAYPIDKFIEGYYVLMEFNANTSVPKELEALYKVTDDVLRYIIVKKGE